MICFIFNLSESIFLKLEKNEFSNKKHLSFVVVNETDKKIVFEDSNSELIIESKLNEYKDDTYCFTIYSTNVGLFLIVNYLIIDEPINHLEDTVYPTYTAINLWKQTRNMDSLMFLKYLSSVLENKSKRFEFAQQYIFLLNAFKEINKMK